jgi:alpha-tubulin suppressor-like RCC1 family protein
MELFRTRRAGLRHHLVVLTACVAMLAAAGASAASASGYGAASWGSNLYRQLGDGSVNASSAVPVGVVELSGVSAVAAGGRHSLALLGTGTVEAWGADESGQLGNGGSAPSNVPVAVSGLSGVTAVAAGAGHSLALLSNGTVMAWGNNESGQLGTGNTLESAVPVAVKGLTGVKAIAAGANHSLALLANGTVMAWGENEAGQLGNGKFTNSTVPVAVKGLTGVTAIAGGAQHSLALLSNGSVMAWGDDTFGQLGNASAEEGSAVPVAVLGLSGVSAIAAGANHSLALSGGTIMAWGDDERGQLGNGTTAHSFETPVAVSGLGGVLAIAAGGARGMALLSGGTVVDWGDDEWGALGNGTAGGFSSTPVAVSGLSGVAGISAGAGHSLTYGEPLPSVTSVSPSSGPTAGGTEVTIGGANLSGATSVRFGANAATSFSVLSAGSISAVAPPGSGTVDVTVTTPGGTTAVRAGDKFTYVAPPAVTKVAPGKGGVTGGTSVKITGTSLANASSVMFGANPAASYSVISPTSILATSPPAAAGLVDVRVTTPLGTSPISTKDHFAYLPSVTAVSPTGGPVAGGVQVTINGTGFALGATATIVKFGTKRAAISGVNCTSSTTCTVVAPAHAAGVVDVRVAVNKETSPLNRPADQFTYG